MIEEIKIDRLEELIHEMMIKIRNTSVTNTEEGNPIEIESAAAAPLVNCLSAITGSQDLHGYDKPWAGGTGKNMVDININTTQYSGSWTFNSPITETVTISVKKNSVVTNENVWIVDVLFQDDTHIYIGDEGYSLSFPQTIVVSDSNPITKINYRNYGLVSGSYDVQVELGSTATSYEPYANICQITAYTAGSVEVEDEDEQSTTYAATFTDPIYQGSIDYVAKKTTATWGYIASYDGETLPGLWISDRDVYAAGTTPTTGAEVAYELASAAVETVTVSNAPISAVHGYNKIESSTGEMEVTYITEDFEPLVPTA